MNFLNNLRVILIFFSTFIFCNPAFPGRTIWEIYTNSQNANLIKFYDCNTESHSTAGFIIVSDEVMKSEEIKSIITDQYKDPQNEYRNAFWIYSVDTVDDKSCISLLPSNDVCDEDQSFVKDHLLYHPVFLLNSVFNLIKFRDNSQGVDCLKSIGSSSVIINNNNYDLYSKDIAQIKSDIPITLGTHHIAVIESDTLGESPFSIFEKTVCRPESFRKLYQVIDKKRVIVFIRKPEQRYISFVAFISGLFGYILDPGLNGITHVPRDSLLTKSQIGAFDMQIGVEYVQSKLRNIDDSSLDKKDYGAFWPVISKFMGFQPEPDSDSDSDSWG